MRIHKLTLILSLAGVLVCNLSHGVTTIVSDNYNVTASDSGFDLNTGINTGINPPTTRLTGTAKANLRYLPTGTKASNSFTITNNKLQVTAAANPGRFVLSANGLSSFDFGPVLGIGGASAANPVVYDLSIKMKNDSVGAERFSFGIATAEGDLNFWDFGVQLYRTNSGNNFYTIGKRIDSASAGLASDLNAHITSLTPYTFANELTFLIRVTDTGAETTTFKSRVQLSLNGGNSWFYDTATDPDLAATGFRFDGAGRHILWDVAGNASATYDSFSLKLDPPLSNANTSAVFRAMSYNIHWAAGPDGEVDTQRISDFIIAKDVDIVGFNEVARFWPQRASGRDIIGEIAEQTGMSFVFDNNKDGLTGNDSFGNAILSKFPILARDHRLLPKVGDNEQRGWHKAIVDVNGKFISFWTSHLDFKAAHTERLMCGTNFNQWVDDEVFPVIIVGDFNDTPNSPIYDLMEKKWADIWLTAGDGTLGRTVPCPGPPGARIDYIWKAKSSTSLVPTNAEVGSLEASDHFSVMTQFILTNFSNRANGFYFPCDQGSGANVVDSINGLKGTFTTGGTGWNTSSPTEQSGDFSLYFNGARKVTVVDTNQIIGTNGLNDNYTLQAWVKLPLNYTPAQRAVLFQSERKPGFSFSINTNRTLHTTAFKIKDIPSTATVPNDGQWHHIAVVHSDKANMKFYIDAALAATVVYTNGAGYRTQTAITIGSAEDGANPFIGNLDRIRFDNQALTPAQFDFPAAPQLRIRQNGNALTLFWPAATTGYTLQANGNLQTAGWLNISSQIQGGENQAVITPTNAARFFRLQRP